MMGDFSETIVQTTGNQHSTVLVERLNNGTHFLIFPHSGFSETDVNWLHVGAMYSGADIQQGQIDINYSTKTLCSHVQFGWVRRFDILFFEMATWRKIRTNYSK